MCIRLLIALFILAALTTSASRADFASSERWFNSLDQDTRFIVQANLVLVGLYDRFIDGEFGPGTFAALRNFDSRGGGTPDGVLSKRQMDQLQAAAAKIYLAHGYEEVRDTEGGVSVYVPVRLLPRRSSATRGTLYSAEDGAMALETVNTPISEQSFQSLFTQMSTARSGRQISYSSLDDGVFTVSGTDRGRRFYARFFHSDVASIGYSLSWSEQESALGQMVSIMLANFSYPLKKADRLPTEQAPNEEATTEPQVGFGTGFFVSDRGLIITNYHVAGNCKSINVPRFGGARLVKGDPDLDLAAIELDDYRAGTRFAKVRRDPPTLGESVVLIGFPLAQLLNSSINVATGIVSAETGLGGESNWFTTNVGIQPGNSGGPIVDLRGNVVGVVVAKIDDAKMLATIGNVAPNVGFAINNQVLLDFLDIFKHDVVRGSQGPEFTVQVIADSAKTFTVQVVCES